MQLFHIYKVQFFRNKVKALAVYVFHQLPPSSSDEKASIDF